MSWFVRSKELFSFSFAGRSLRIIYAKICGNNNPREQGSADRYYGRERAPNYYNKNGKHIKKESMTEEQITEYNKGWDEEEDRKDWGEIL